MIRTKGRAADVNEAPAGDGGCGAVICPCPSAELLESEWRNLHARSDGSVFLSWPWIEALLTVLRPDALLFRLMHEGRTVALALLGQRSGSLLPWRRASLHLNETGDPLRDSVMIEYNGLLCQRGWENDARERLLEAIAADRSLARRDLHLSGLHLPGATEGRGNPWRRRELATWLSRPPQMAPFVDLNAMPADPLAGISRNSRQQIRRSLRYYQQRGALQVERAADLPQALDWLDQLERLHTCSWQRRGKSGAFSQPSFKAFHRRLISTGFAEGVPDLLRARAGDSILGYLYNLRWGNQVYSYQSGFCYEEAAQGRPGLVTHILAMQMYRAGGMGLYKFLAGQARYKQSLAAHQDHLLWMTARHSALPCRLIQAMGRSIARRAMAE